MTSAAVGAQPCGLVGDSLRYGVVCTSDLIKILKKLDLSNLFIELTSCNDVLVFCRNLVFLDSFYQFLMFS